MSGFHVLQSVSEQLRQTIWTAVREDPATRDLLASEMDVVFTNPTETARHRSSTNKLSVWLYQVTENEFLKNQYPVRVNAAKTQGNDHTLQQDPPLPLNLYYLMTPYGPTDGNPDAELLLLGKVLQVMYDNPTLYVQSPPDDVFEELRVILCRLTLEELTRIWEALREPYRLSVCYQIRVTRVDSDRVASHARVVQLDSNYAREV